MVSRIAGRMGWQHSESPDRASPKRRAALFAPTSSFPMRPLLEDSLGKLSTLGKPHGMKLALKTKGWVVWLDRASSISFLVQN